MLGHEREVAHEHLGLLYLARLIVGEPHQHLERRRVGHIPLAAFGDAVLGGRIQCIVDKLQLEIAVEIGNRRDVSQNFFQIFLEEALIGILLYLDQIGHLHHFVDTGEAFADPVFPHRHVVYPDVLHDLRPDALIADVSHECHHP